MGNMELWYFEDHDKGIRFGIKCVKTLYSYQSEYQQIDVLETVEFGRMLLLDGLVMLTQRDEFIYHEMITHPALFAHPAPEKVLVIGGGDGGTVRELARHNCLREIVLCEIDRHVVDTSMRFFPEIACSMDDSRVTILYQDGADFARQQPSRFDLIIIDSTDPVGPGEVLFSQEFYTACLSALRPGGILAAQTESPVHHLELMRDIKRRLESAGFSKVRFYTAPIPTYPGGFWSWCLASADNLRQAEADDLSGFSPARTMDKELLQELRYYNREIHEAAFCLPQFMKKIL